MWRAMCWGLALGAGLAQAQERAISLDRLKSGIDFSGADVRKYGSSTISLTPGSFLEHDRGRRENLALDTYGDL